MCFRGETGTTSACAENTGVRHPIFPHPRNYLRVRGEYEMLITEAEKCLELPPRARRIHIEFDLGKAPIGTTSACAENTAGECGWR